MLIVKINYSVVLQIVQSDFHKHNEVYLHAKQMGIVLLLKQTAYYLCLASSIFADQ